MGKIQQEVSKLLPLLYQAPGDAGKWDEFIEALSLAMGASQGLLIHHNAKARHTCLASAYNLEKEFADSYEAYYQYKNPYLNLPPSMLPQRGTLGFLEELIPDKEVQKTEFFNDYVIPQGLTVRKAIRITPFQSPDTFTSIALHRAKDDPARNASEAKRLCDHLMPHLQTALQMHNRIAGLQSQIHNLNGTLDRMPLGVVLFDTSLCPFFVSKRAKAILDQDDGIMLKNGQLLTTLPCNGISLGKLIDNALGMLLGSSSEHAGALRVKRSSGKRPYELLVTPLFEQSFSSIGRTSGAAVFLSDPDADIQTPGEILRSLYGLTQAEMRVALLLVQGLSSAEVANELEISRETFKSHLKHIFRKTDTRRQGELVGVLLRGGCG